MSATPDKKKPKLDEMKTSDAESLPEQMDIDEPPVFSLLQDTTVYFGVQQQDYRVLKICMEVS